MFLQSFSRNQWLLLHAWVKSRPFKKILPSTILLYTPENWHDNETTTIKKGVSPIRKGDFPASHVSFLKNNCNNYAQLKRHYGTAPCRSSSTKKQTTLLTWGCRPHFVVSLPSWRTKKQHGRVWHQVSNILARKECHDQTCWIVLIHFRDLAFSISKWHELNKEHESSYPALLGKGKPINSITGAFSRSHEICCVYF